MNKVSRKLWGIVLIILGVIFLLNALDITNINIFFNGWWTLLIIIPSLINLFNPNKEGKFSSLIWLIVGIVLLLLMQGILNMELVIKLFIPVVFLVSGIYLIFGNVIKNELNTKIKSFNTEKKDEYCSTFSNQNIVIEEKFKQVNADAIFGGLTLDLHDCEIKDESLIKASAIFGELTIIVPKDVVVKVKSLPIFGGVSNNCRHNVGKKVIYIDAVALFGSVDIK